MALQRKLAVVDILEEIIDNVASPITTPTIWGWLKFLPPIPGDIMVKH
jgi:hypothetical protein